MRHFSDKERISIMGMVEIVFERPSVKTSRIYKQYKVTVYNIPNSVNVRVDITENKQGDKK